MFYYRCKYVLDFYIVFFLSMLSQAFVFNKIFNLPYKQLVFVSLSSSDYKDHRQQSTYKQAVFGVS